MTAGPNNEAAGASGTLTPREADELRTRVRGLIKEERDAEWEVADVLYRVASDDRQHVQRWGYPNWEAWVERELGILRRKAQYLRRLHEWFVIEHPLPDVLFLRLRRLGWTKARQLIGIMNAENATALLADIESMTHAELGPYLRRRTQGVTEDVGPEIGNESGTMPITDSAGVPIEKRQRVIADLFGDQIETYELAIKRSMELSRSQKIGNNLSLICLDFLATNDFKFDNEEQRLRFLAKFENLMGYKLVIIDPEAGEVVYGIKTLETHARSASADDDQAP